MGVSWMRNQSFIPVCFLRLPQYVFSALKGRPLILAAKCNANHKMDGCPLVPCFQHLVSHAARLTTAGKSIKKQYKKTAEIAITSWQIHHQIHAPSVMWLQPQGLMTAFLAVFAIHLVLCVCRGPECSQASPSPRKGSAKRRLFWRYRAFSCGGQPGARRGRWRH